MIKNKDITVSLKESRWNRLLELEKAYKASRRIKRALKQSESATSMSPGEAQAFIMTL